MVHRVGAQRPQALSNFTVVQLRWLAASRSRPRVSSKSSCSGANRRAARPPRLADLESAAERRPTPKSAAAPVANDALDKRSSNAITGSHSSKRAADRGHPRGRERRRARVGPSASRRARAQAQATREETDRLRAELATLAAEKQSAVLEVDALRTLWRSSALKARHSRPLAGREARHNELAEQSRRDRT